MCCLDKLQVLKLELRNQLLLQNCVNLPVLVSVKHVVGTYCLFWIVAEEVYWCVGSVSQEQTVVALQHTLFHQLQTHSIYTEIRGIQAFNKH